MVNLRCSLETSLQEVLLPAGTTLDWSQVPSFRLGQGRSMMCLRNPGPRVRTGTASCGA